MTLTFIQLSGFANEWRHFRLDDEDLRVMERILLARPESGATVAGAGGLRKMRFAPPSRRSGKSGAYRVAYAYFATSGVILLLAIFAKADQTNLTAAERARFRTVIQFFKERS
jgi:hypothetical protein